MNGRRYASERGVPTGRSTTPSYRTHRPSSHPINDTREASRLSDLPPLAAHFNQRNKLVAALHDARFVVTKDSGVREMCKTPASRRRCSNLE